MIMNNAKKEILELLHCDPLIAAIRDENGFRAALESNIPVIFLLNSNILSLAQQCEQLAAQNKKVFVHIDLVDGLSSVPVAVDFISQMTPAAGILTTHGSIIKRAAELDLLSIYRIFMLDGVALQRAKRNIDKTRPNFLEIMPGMMPTIIERLTDYTRIPVIAGGLLTQDVDIRNALRAGAVGVSSTNPDLWGRCFSLQAPDAQAGQEERPEHAGEKG